MLRLAPGHGAAQIAAADPQAHRHQSSVPLVVRGPAKRTRTPPLLTKLFTRRGIAAGDLADIGQEQHRNMLPDQLADVALCDFGERRQRPLQIINVGQKRLVVPAVAAETMPARRSTPPVSSSCTAPALSSPAISSRAVWLRTSMGRAIWPGRGSRPAEAPAGRRQGFATAADGGDFGFLQPRLPARMAVTEKPLPSRTGGNRPKRGVAGPARTA